MSDCVYEYHVGMTGWLRISILTGNGNDDRLADRHVGRERRLGRAVHLAVAGAMPRTRHGLPTWRGFQNVFMSVMEAGTQFGDRV